MSDLAATLRLLQQEANPASNPGARPVNIAVGTVSGLSPLAVTIGTDVVLYGERLSSYTPSVGHIVVVVTIGERSIVLGLITA